MMLCPGLLNWWWSRTLYSIQILENKINCHSLIGNTYNYKNEIEINSQWEVYCSILIWHNHFDPKLFFLGHQKFHCPTKLIGRHVQTKPNYRRWNFLRPINSLEPEPRYDPCKDLIISLRPSCISLLESQLYSDLLMHMQLSKYLSKPKDKRNNESDFNSNSVKHIFTYLSRMALCTPEWYPH